MLMALTLTAKVLLILASVAGIGICCGTAFVCTLAANQEKHLAARVEFAFFGTLSVVLTIAFTWMLLSVGSL